MVGPRRHLVSVRDRFYQITILQRYHDIAAEGLSVIANGQFGMWEMSVVGEKLDGVVANIKWCMCPGIYRTHCGYQSEYIIYTVYIVSD